MKIKNSNIITAPHNIQFDHMTRNLMYFRVIHFPRKALIKALVDDLDREIKITDFFLRVILRVTGDINIWGVARYEVKDKVENSEKNVRNCYTITEKEAEFFVEYTKEEVAQIVEPHLIELDAVMNKRSANLFRSHFREWAHPLSLSEVVNLLSDEQRQEAAYLLKDHFAV